MAEGKAEASRYAKVAAMSDAIPLNKPIERFPNDFIRKSLLERRASPSSSPTTSPWLPALDYLPAGTPPPKGSPPLSEQFQAPSPLSMLYAGHQFGQFNPALGDGRAILIGELVDGEGRTVRYSIKRKWTNPTLAQAMAIAARTRDPRIFNVRVHVLRGRANVQKSCRDIRIGIPFIGSGGNRWRAHAGRSSHIRFGTFQYFAARGDDEALQQLATM